MPDNLIGHRSRKYDAVRTLPHEGTAFGLDGLVAAMSSSPSNAAWELDLAESLGEGASALAGLTPRLAEVLHSGEVHTEPTPGRATDSENNDVLKRPYGGTANFQACSTVRLASTLLQDVELVKLAALATVIESEHESVAIVALRMSVRR